MAMAEEEDNFIRIFKLVSGVAPIAVRHKFDNYFPPLNLTNELKQKENKLKDLHSKKRLTTTQMALLFPITGVTSSSNYDVTLMICLIRNLTTIRKPGTGFDELPLSTDTSEGADLARVKHYRNKIAHSDIDRLPTTEFTIAWNDLEQALVRLGGSNVKTLCDDIKLAVLNHDILLEVRQRISQFREEINLQLEQLNSNVVALDTQMAEMNEWKQDTTSQIEEMVSTSKGINKKFEEYSCHEKKKLQEVIPPNIRVQIDKRITEWENNDKKFVTTAASKHVLKSARTNSCVTVTGSSGSGKSAIVRHVALTLQREGYRIIPIDKPTELKKYYQPEIQTVFIVDDICGNFIVNHLSIQSWKQMFETVKLITEDKFCKIIVSCRLQIYKDPSFNIMKPFKMFECNITSAKICLSLTERKSIAQSYLGTHATKIDEVIHLYDFFPLLCYLYDENKHHDVKEFFNNPFEMFEKELDDLYNHGDEGKHQICALALCVMFNNKLKEEYFTGKDPHVQKVIEETCEAVELNRGTSKVKLKTSLDTLDGTFICRQGDLYRTRHDKIFDIITYYFGKKVLQCIIRNSDSNVICERFEWITGDKKCENDYTIKLPDDCLELYIDRMISDWSNRNVGCVFDNNNLKSPAFRARFLKHVLKLDRSEQEKLVNITENVTTEDFALGSTALMAVSSYGCIDFTQWLLDNGADAGATRKDGASSLHIACGNGHLGVVCKLLECKNVDPNLRESHGASPLYLACQYGHPEVVYKLLECNADPNVCDKRGASPLYLACLDGHLEVVCKLLECRNIDLNLCEEYGGSPLWRACYEGHVSVVCKLLECDDVNRNLCDNTGRSPLFIACQGGHLEVVCKLLECDDVNRNLCDNTGRSPLFIACQGGHLEVVYKLLECNNVDPNLCQEYGWSPLFVACMKGHLEVVCKLLECKNVDPYLCSKHCMSPLWIACGQGHLKVVCRLLEYSNVHANLCDEQGRSPLYIACEHGNLEVVRKLLECSKVNPNLCDEQGRSPLYIACEHCNLEVVRKLLECSKVNPNLCDKNGRSPLEIAFARGNWEVYLTLAGMV